MDDVAEDHEADLCQKEDVVLELGGADVVDHDLYRKRVENPANPTTQPQTPPRRIR